MDVKDLNKSQVILLAILVSFVISIGTSIVIVSLMQEAPAEVIRPINRIIKETVEKVIRVESPKVDGLSEEEVTALVNKILSEKEAVALPEAPVETVPAETLPEPVPEETTL